MEEKIREIDATIKKYDHLISERLQNEEQYFFLNHAELMIIKLLMEIRDHLKGE